VTDPDRQVTVAREEETNEEETTSSTSAHIHARARSVFEQLRRLGMKARSYGEHWDEETDVPGENQQRRVHSKESREFEQALETLTAGDLEVALEHFLRLRERLPDSERVERFIEAIEAGIRGLDSDGDEITRRIAYSFEDLVEGALAAGRCPRCFTQLASERTDCPSCGLQARPNGKGRRDTNRSPPPSPKPKRPM
jgi:hypothetical protein